MTDLFLDSSVLKDAELDFKARKVIETGIVGFGFPDGFNEIRLIERLRLLETIGDKKQSEQDKFDLAYDIMMQKLEGRKVEVYWKEKGRRNLAFSFLISNRHMDLNAVRQLASYPCIVQWLVHFITADEIKKYPLSLEALTSESEEHTKKSRK